MTALSAAAAVCWPTARAPAQCSGGVWIPMPPLQIARQETGAARIGNSVYVVGGLLASGATNTVEVYSTASNTWAFAPAMPGPLHHMAVAELGGLLYVIGGVTDSGVRSGVDVYDPVSMQWTVGPALPEARGACWAAASNGRLFVFGGVNSSGVATASTFIFDPLTQQWSPGAAMPTAREHLTAVAWRDYIYVIGGRAGPSTGANERYHPATNTWQVLAPMPTPRSATLTAVLPSGAGAAGRIYVAGGEVPALYAVNETYDIVINSWSCQAPMALPRHGVPAVSLGDRILAAGGGTAQGLAPTAAADAFIPACYPNCDASTAAPILNVNDFVCFFGRFIAQDPWADCDQSGSFNVEDFICFQSAYAAGCP